MSIDVTNNLLKKEVSTGELEVFLNTYFPVSSQTGKNKITHGGKLTVEYYGKNNEKHSQSEIKSIYLVDEKDTELLAALEQESHKALSTDNGTEIGRVVLFSGSEVKANYRFREEFQISPIPKNAPKPNELLADHPFILEFSYKKSSHPLINMHRRTKNFEALSLILNVFIKMGVTCQKNNIHKVWAIVSDESSPSSYEIRNVQLGYWLKDDEEVQRDQYGFTIYKNELEFTKLPSIKYFLPYSITVGDELSLPDNIDDLISKFYSLSEKDKTDFLRASYWKRVSSETHYISRSNAYIALVNAIESLIPQEKSSGTCENCQNEIKKGLTQLFHDFVEQYCPGLESAHKKELYSIRSKYTHGKQLMQDDLGSMGFRFNVANNNELENYRTIAQVVQVAMINWLCGR